jgi:hypothetical protein
MAMKCKVQMHGGADRRHGGGAAQHDEKRECGKQDAGHQRDPDEQLIPDDPALHLERCHACIMHRADAGAEHGATDQIMFDAAAQGRDPHAGGGEHDGSGKRKHRQFGVVGVRYARREGDHGDEMRRPDAKTGRCCRNHQPGIAVSVGRAVDMAEQIDRRKRKKCHK